MHVLKYCFSRVFQKLMISNQCWITEWILTLFLDQNLAIWLQVSQVGYLALGQLGWIYGSRSVRLDIWLQVSKVEYMALGQLGWIYGSRSVRLDIWLQVCKVGYMTIGQLGWIYDSRSVRLDISDQCLKLYFSYLNIIRTQFCRLKIFQNIIHRNQKTFLCGKNSIPLQLYKKYAKLYYIAEKIHHNGIMHTPQ